MKSTLSVMEDDALHVYRRKCIELQDFTKFNLFGRSFEKQFSSIYTARLAALRDHVYRKAKTKWARYKVLKLSEIEEKTDGDLCIVIGTLYKHQGLKPSILREISDELQLHPQPAASNYASIKDLLFLEDETLRVKLVGNHMKIQDVVTGIVCAVLGYELESGAFLVEDSCFPEYCPKPTTVERFSNIGGKVLFISGLNIASTIHSLSLTLLSEWITGMIGCKDSQKEVSSIVCVIIAGNSVRGSSDTYDHKSYFETKAHNEKIFKETTMFTQKLDTFLKPIVQCCPVIILPGEFDPTCHTIPQQPFHPCILPQSSRFKSLHGVTNPWIGSINSRIIAGSSGQPILDIMKVAGLSDVTPLTWLERTLTWRHFAPTAPDTLPAYPYFKTDPFVMTDCPDIYFVGNMEQYDTKIVKGDNGEQIRLICIPKFCKKQMGVIVDLQDLETYPVSFGVS